MKTRYRLQISNGSEEINESLYKGYSKDNCKRRETIYGIAKLFDEFQKKYPNWYELDWSEINYIQ